MNDILNIIPYFAIYSIIPSIFILNQSAKYRSVKKALPSVIAAWACYSFFIYHFYDIYMTLMFVIYLYITVIPIAIVFLIYMGYNIWNQSYFNLATELKPVPIWKQILVPILIPILSAFNPYAASIMQIYLDKYNANNIGIINVLIAIWFLSLAVIGYNIRKLNNNAIILKIINKIGTVIIWGMILLYAMMMARIIG